MKRVKISDFKNLKDFKNIDEYLLYTYGNKKLELSKRHSDPTFLDVIGYTLDKNGYERVESAHYELHEIEDMMFERFKENMGG